MSLRVLNSHLQKKAIKELNEDPSKVEDLVKSLRQWLETHPYIKSRTDDQWLVAFLRGCKYDMVKVKEKLDLFYTVKYASPEFSTNLDLTIPKFAHLIRLGFFIPLPKTTCPDSPRTFICRPGLGDPKKFNFLEVMKMPYIAILLHMMNDDNFTISGGQVILDCNDITFRHVIGATPFEMRKSSKFVQECIPVRLKGFFYINMPYKLELLVNFIKTLLSEKLKARVHGFGTDYSKLYDHVPQDILPVEYGGNAGSIQDMIDSTVNNLDKNHSLLMEEDQYVTDESKRKLILAEV